MSITETYKLLAKTVLAAAGTVVYTVPTGARAIVKHVRIVNPKSDGATAVLWLASGSPTDADVWLPTTELLQNEACEFNGTLTLEAGMKIRGAASADSILNVFVSGVELSG